MEIREAIERSMHSNKTIESVEHRSRYPWDMDFLQRQGILYTVDFFDGIIILQVVSVKRGYSVKFSYLN